MPIMMDECSGQLAGLEMELPFHYVRARGMARSVGLERVLVDPADDVSDTHYSRKRPRSTFVAHVDWETTVAKREVNCSKGDIHRRAKISYGIAYAVLGSLIALSLVALFGALAGI